MNNPIHDVLVVQASVLADMSVRRSEQDSRLQSEQGRLRHQWFVK